MAAHVNKNTISVDQLPGVYHTFSIGVMDSSLGPSSNAFLPTR